MQEYNDDKITYDNTTQLSIRIKYFRLWVILFIIITLVYLLIYFTIYDNSLYIQRFSEVQRDLLSKITPLHPPPLFNFMK
jgi:cytochrome c oxidase subunit IV